MSDVAPRVHESRQRVAQLKTRMSRLRSGEAPTKDDVEQAQRAAKEQFEAAMDAHRRLLARRASAARRRLTMQQSWRSPMVASQAKAYAAMSEEIERLRNAMAAIQSSDRGAVLPDERVRRVWRELIDECRSPSWHGWANALCTIATRLLPSIRGAALTLYDDCRVAHPLAATDRWTWDTELMHQIVGEGPAFEVCRTRLKVMVDHLDDVYDRWPGFVDLAAGAGVRGICAFPFELGGLTGSLTLYRTMPGPYDVMESATGAALARVAASVLIADADAVSDVDPLAYLSDYDDVSIAAGILSVRLGISVKQARLELRARSYGGGRSLIDVAQAVIREIA